MSSYKTIAPILMVKRATTKRKIRNFSANAFYPVVVYYKAYKSVNKKCIPINELSYLYLTSEYAEQIPFLQYNFMYQEYFFLRL